jgi:hypothetical protein
VTFGNDLVRMRIDGRSHRVSPTTAAVVSYEIERGGGYRRVAAGAAPHCA